MLRRADLRAFHRTPKENIRERRMQALWRARVWPPICRAFGGNDLQRDRTGVSLAYLQRSSPERVNNLFLLACSTHSKKASDHDKEIRDRSYSGNPGSLRAGQGHK
jgi:hypothetical protein